MSGVKFKFVLVQYHLLGSSYKFKGFFQPLGILISPINKKHKMMKHFSWRLVRCREGAFDVYMSKLPSRQRSHQETVAAGKELVSLAVARGKGSTFPAATSQSGNRLLSSTPSKKENYRILFRRLRRRTDYLFALLHRRRRRIVVLPRRRRRRKISGSFFVVKERRTNYPSSTAKKRDTYCVSFFDIVEKGLCICSSSTTMKKDNT
jgi:hypothetical protein